MMTVTAARQLADGAVCFVGIRLRSAACNLARRTQAPEIAAHAREVLVIMKQSRRSVVPRLDFLTSCGYLGGAGERSRAGFPGGGPRAVITDFGILRPHPQTEELQLCAIYPGVTLDAVRAATAWPLRVAHDLQVLPAPQPADLATLRALHTPTPPAPPAPLPLN